MSQKTIQKALKTYQAREMRTLAFAYHEAPKNHEGLDVEHLTDDMIWLGFAAIAAVILVGQILIVQFGGSIFRTVPLSAKDWLLIIAGTSVVLWIGELLRLDLFKFRRQLTLPRL